MKSMIASGTLGLVLASLAWSAGGTIAGVVKDPSGAGLSAAFVRARSAETKITYSVLSDMQGKYRIKDLPIGEYEVRVKAVGFKADPRTGVKLTEGQTQAIDIPLQKGMVQWNDLNIYQGRVLLPAGKGKETLTRFDVCFACHGFQSRIAMQRRDEDGWQRAVDYMRDVQGGFGSSFIGGKGSGRGLLLDSAAAEVVSYLTTVFGPDSTLPRSPAELPEYKSTVRAFSPEGLKIEYVEYDLPGPNRMPWGASPYKDGRIVWMPYYGRGNHIGKLDSVTGKVEEYQIPKELPAGIHSVKQADDGLVWFVETMSGHTLGKFDPETKQMTEYKSPGGGHTIRFDSQGNVFAGATRFNPKTGEFTKFPANTYGIAIDKEDNVWYTEFTPMGKLGKVDTKTGKVTKYDPLTPTARPRRLQVDSDGVVWFGEYVAGKMGRFDPKTETMKEYALPGPSPSPYGITFDKRGRLWYSSEDQDTINCFDTKTGKVIEYPTPYPENGMRDIYTDSQGRIWINLPPNNKVAYFIPPEN